jgi:hypothetical protein
VLDKFYYHYNTKWLLFTASDEELLKIIFEKIQYIIYEVRINVYENFDKLVDYVGIGFNTMNNKIDPNNVDLLINSEVKKNKYIAILKLEFMQKFSLHELSRIE